MNSLFSKQEKHDDGSDDSDIDDDGDKMWVIKWYYPCPANIH